MGPRTVLDTVVKRKIPSPRRESNPRTSIVQPIAQEAKVITLPEPGKDPKFPQNLKPITLLFTTGKLFERGILKIFRRRVE
jgi:hypothetical protein